MPTAERARTALLQGILGLRHSMKEPRLACQLDASVSASAVGTTVMLFGV